MAGNSCRMRNAAMNQFGKSELALGPHSTTISASFSPPPPKMHAPAVTITNPLQARRRATATAVAATSIEVQLAAASTEAELLQAFDAILAASSSSATTVTFSTVTSLALQRMQEVGAAVWTKRVAVAYGDMLRERKRVEEGAAAPAVQPPPLVAAGRALFAGAVSTDNTELQRRLRLRCSRAGKALFAGAVSTGVDSGAGGGDPGSEWQRYYDENTGHYYWTHGTTGESTWHDPFA